MEKEYQISWLKIVGVTALIAIIVVIICLIYPKKDNTLLIQQTYINNITLMKDAGFEYFTGSNLPKEIGEAKRITLDEMLARNLIVDFYDEKGNSCNIQNSYIEATKTMDTEYEMSVFLSCDNKSDYIVTSISNEVICKDCDVEQNLSVDTTDVDNNSNEGSGSSIKNPTYTTGAGNNSSTNERPVNVTQTTNVNINYVNTCCPSDSSNCKDDCLANIYHSVEFDANGGSSVRTQIVKHGTTATYVESYRYGYEFLGWYLNGEKYDFKTLVTEKITLYAKWKKKEIQEEDKEKYLVDFDSNGGSYVKVQEVEDGGLVIRPEDPVRECYDFAGWYIDSALTQKYDFNTPVTSDMTLYAKWRDNGTCKDSHLVDFDSNGGSYVKPQEIEDGKLVMRPGNPTRECYDFVGWYIDSALTKKYDFTTPVTSDMTLYAKWRDNGTCNNTYTVKFNSNGGSYVSSQEIDEGNRANEPNDPVRSGYTFLGWYLNGSKFNFNTRIYEDITLVAKWDKKREQYNEYCKIEEDTYYSISYVSNEKNTWNYSWEIKFDDIKNALNVKVTDFGHLTTNSMYNIAAQKFDNKGISMTTGNGGGVVNPLNGSILRTYSLKANNFVPSVGSPYYSNGIWYARLSVNIRNYNNVTSYYASNIKNYIYFVPFYLSVEYTDLTNCVTDKASNSYKYKDYEVVDSFWQ